MFDQAFGITFTGEWSEDNKAIVRNAVWLVAHRISGGQDVATAFQNVYGNVEFEWCKDCVNGAGWAAGDHLIKFDYMYSNPAIATRLVIHELGHLFDRAVCAKNQGGSCGYIWAGEGTARADLNGKTDTCVGPKCLGRGGYAGPGRGEYWGFAGGWEEWQFGQQNSTGELWADMFLGWVFNAWGKDRRGEYRRDYMNERMAFYLTTNFASP